MTDNDFIAELGHVILEEIGRSIAHSKNVERLCLIKEKIDLRDRCAGRTTRLVDKYIQDLYNNIGKWVEVHDHYQIRPNQSCWEADKMIMDKILARMKLEHPNDVIEVDRHGRKLKLVTCLSSEKVSEMLDEINKRLKDYTLNNKS